MLKFLAGKNSCNWEDESASRDQKRRALIGGKSHFGAMMQCRDLFTADVVSSNGGDRVCNTSGWDQHLEDCLSLFENEMLIMEEKSTTGSQVADDGSVSGSGVSDTESNASWSAGSCGSPQSCFPETYLTRQRLPYPSSRTLQPVPGTATAYPNRVPTTTQGTSEYCYMNLDCGDLEYENHSIMNNKMPPTSTDIPSTSVSPLQMMQDVEYPAQGTADNTQRQDFTSHHQIMEYSDTKVFAALEVSPQGTRDLGTNPATCMGNSRLPPVQCVQPGMGMGMDSGLGFPSHFSNSSNNNASFNVLNNTRPASNMSESSYESFESDAAEPPTLPSCNISHYPSSGTQDYLPGESPELNQQLSDILAKLPPSYEQHIAAKVKPEDPETNFTSCAGQIQNGVQSRQHHHQEFWRPSEPVKTEEGKF